MSSSFSRSLITFGKKFETLSRISEVHGELMPFLHLHRKIPVVPDRHFEELWNMLQSFITTYFGV
jgi:hypothetical protein